MTAGHCCFRRSGALLVIAPEVTPSPDHCAQQHLDPCAVEMLTLHVAVLVYAVHVVLLSVMPPTKVGPYGSMHVPAHVWPCEAQ